ncbi:MAG: phosphatidylglycerophosphatase A [Ignavibacteriaceae bacterium]|nr:phosphatidylglycerophosphatase A [Ignavibacteriaceae bacterium]
MSETKKLNFIVKLTGSGLFTGYFPVASGTVASFAAICMYAFIPGFTNLYFFIPLILVTIAAGIYTGNKFEEVYGKDPSECTIDEFAGQWISLIGVPVQPELLAINFIIWRVLDIIKPYPANRLEKLDGGKGIMADDIMSGVYTLVIMQILLNFFIKIVEK